MYRSAAIKRARQVMESYSEKQPLACFYFSFSHQETHDIRTVIASLLVQLCEDSPALFEDVNRVYSSNNSQHRQTTRKMSLHEGLTILTEAGEHISGAVLFFDAINESQQSRKVLSLVKELVHKMPSIRIMISSTEELDDPFNEQEAKIIFMESEAISHDIEIFIRTWLEENPHLSALPDSLKEKISSTLSKGNRGVCVVLYWLKRC